MTSRTRITSRKARHTGSSIKSFTSEAQRALEKRRLDLVVGSLWMLVLKMGKADVSGNLRRRKKGKCRSQLPFPLNGLVIG